MSNLKREKIGKYIDVLTDYHSNGSYESLREHVTLLSEKNYAVMIRTLNFERNDFSEDLIYVDKQAYDFLSKSKVRPDDILTNKIANPGSIYIMPDLECPVTCGMNLFLIRFSPDVNQRYMYYCMKNSEAYIKSFAHGTTTKTITKEEIRDIDLLINTDITEQNKIAAVLTSIDKKISLNNKINDNLQHQLQTLYDYWFAQFDFPDENGRPYRSSGGQMVWCEELKREIPLGWEVKSLSQLIKKNSQPFDYASEQPTIDLSVMPSNSIALSDLNNSSNFTTNLYMMKRGDILFGSIRPYLHKAGIAPCDGVFAGTVHSYSVLEADNYNFALFSICRDAFFDYAVNVSAGTKMPVVSSDSVLAFKVPYSAKIAHSFNQISVMDIITKNVQENQRLIKLRDWLLPMLMNGQATIED